MAERSYSGLEVVTGGVVLLAAIGFFFFASDRGRVASAQSYPLEASFRSAEGIAIGTEVRLAGVRIGAVSEMELNPETFLADVTLQISDAIILPDDSAIAVSSEGLLGGSFVEVIPGGSPFNMGAGDAFQDTQSSVSLITLLLRFVGGDGT